MKKLVKTLYAGWKIFSKRELWF